MIMLEVMEKSGGTFWTCSFLFQVAASRRMINMMGFFPRSFFIVGKVQFKTKASRHGYTTAK